MLILGRKRNQAVYIYTPSGERIKIVVTDIDYIDNMVKIGFDCDEKFKIYRKELITGKNVTNSSENLNSDSSDL